MRKKTRGGNCFPPLAKKGTYEPTLDFAQPPQRHQASRTDHYQRASGRFRDNI